MCSAALLSALPQVPVQVPQAVPQMTKGRHTHILTCHQSCNHRVIRCLSVQWGQSLCDSRRVRHWADGSIGGVHAFDRGLLHADDRDPFRVS